MKTSKSLWLVSVLLFIASLSLLSRESFAEKVPRFRFLVKPKMFYAVPFGSNIKLDCRTNDPAATTVLYHSTFIGSSTWNLLLPSPGKLIKSGQVYTILDFGIPNTGQYQCRATDASGTTIRSRATNLIPNPNLTPPLNIDPNYAVVLTTGQSYNVTCSCVSSSTLQWFKKLNGGSEIAVPNNKIYSERDSHNNMLKMVLMFKNAQKRDAGLYVCRMSFQGKKNFKYSTLGVYDQFQFIRRQPKFMIVSFGASLTIDCTTNEQDANVNLYFRATPSLPWKKLVPKTKKVFKDGQSFTITNVVISNAGNYQCRARNRRGNRIQWKQGYGIVIINPNLIPAVTITPRHAVVLTEGQSRNITCTSIGRTTLQWFKENANGKTIPVQTKRTAKRRGKNKHSVILILRNVQKTDSGSYKCLMTFGHSKTNRKYTSVTVRERFKFVVTPEMSYPVQFQSNFTLNCTTNDPTATTGLYHKRLSTWNLLSPVPGKLIKSGQVYTILDFVVNNTGQYQCRATNDLGTTIKWPPVFLIANPNPTPPLDIYPNQTVVLTTGQSSNVTCSSVSSSTLQWFKKLDNDSEIAVPNDQIHSERDSHNNMLKMVLMFKNAQKRDAGLYVCRMSFQGKKNFKYSTLEVHEHEWPRILSFRKHLLLKHSNNQTTLHCLAYGHPRPDVYWYKNDKQIKIRVCQFSYNNSHCKDKKYQLTYQPITKHTKVNASLTIFNTIFPDDEGRYTCEAVNTQGKVNKTIDVQNKGSSPHLKGRMKVLSVNEPSGAVLSCSATGYPLPEVTWYKGSNLIGCLSNGKPCVLLPQYTLKKRIKLRNNIKIVRSQLKISRTSRARDQGIYFCVASNPNGMARRSYKLTIN